MENQETEQYDITNEVTNPSRELARRRDELLLQLHLGGAEARSHWEELEKKWVLLQSRLSVLEVAGKDTARGVRSALKQLIHELKEGYDRMREAVSRA